MGKYIHIYPLSEVGPHRNGPYLFVEDINNIFGLAEYPRVTHDAALLLRPVPDKAFHVLPDEGHLLLDIAPLHQLRGLFRVPLHPLKCLEVGRHETAGPLRVAVDPRPADNEDIGACHGAETLVDLRIRIHGQHCRPLYLLQLGEAGLPYEGRVHIPRPEDGGHITHFEVHQINIPLRVKAMLGEEEAAGYVNGGGEGEADRLSSQLLKALYPRPRHEPLKAGGDILVADPIEAAVPLGHGAQHGDLAKARKLGLPRRDGIETVHALSDETPRHVEAVFIKNPPLYADPDRYVAVPLGADGDDAVKLRLLAGGFLMFALLTP